MSALMQTYARLPVTFSHGEGVYLYDTEGGATWTASPASASTPWATPTRQ